MILDTNAVSSLLAGEEGIADVLQGAVRHHLPVIVLGEYRFGLRGSRHRKRLERLLDLLEQESVILPADQTTARFYAAIRAGLKKQGTPIPENDVWIAALARQHELAIVSRDEHFDFIPRIRRISW